MKKIIWVYMLISSYVFSNYTCKHNATCGPENAHVWKEWHGTIWRFEQGIKPPYVHSVIGNSVCDNAHLVPLGYEVRITYTQVPGVTHNNQYLYHYDAYGLKCKASPYSQCKEDEIYNEDTSKCIKQCEITGDCCEESDVQFHDQNTTGYTYSSKWKITDENTSVLRRTCTENNGSIESARITCISYERCKISKPTCDENQTLDLNATPPVCKDNEPVCDEEDTPFPPYGDNEKVTSPWTQDTNPQKSEECSALSGRIQEAQVACEPHYRCLIKTDECKIEENEKVASYVDPRNQAFHEDIVLSGVTFGLHYSSVEIEQNQTQTIAYGWSLSNHATLKGDRLTLGNGSLLSVVPYLEANLTVVNTGNSELLFTAQGKHLQTRDLYTKEVVNTFEYDANGSLVSMTNRFNETTLLNRDSNGTLKSITAPHGQTTYLSIDSNGDLVEVQYEDTTSYTFEYENHLMTLEREPNGNAFLHFFDAQGKVIKVIDAELGEWDFGTTSDATSGSHTVTRASGDVITYTNHFLEDGLLKTEKTLPTSDVIYYAHRVDDSYSEITSCGTKTQSTFKTNSDGTLYKDPIRGKRALTSQTVTTPSGRTQTTNYSNDYVFDAQNTLLSVAHTRSSNGATTTSLRDYNQSTSTLTSPEGRVTQTTYDGTNQLPISVTYANLKPTIYKYDTLGRVIKTKQGGRVTKYSYDERGNVAEVHNVQRETKTAYTYDLLGRVTGVTYADGTTEAFSYDNNGNLITRTVPTPADHTFSYNGVNKRTGYTSPLQKATTYTYDKQRRITKVTKPSTKSIDTTYTNGRVTAITTPEGVTTYSYACQNNPSTITKGSESMAFTYDGTLHTSMTQSGQLTQTLSYTYNNDFRVTSFTYAGTTENYSYDKDGLLLSVGVLANAPYTLTRDPQNGLTTNITDGTLDMNQSYNTFGELKTQRTQNFKLRLARQEGRIAKKVEKVVDYYTNAKGKSKKRNTKTIHTYSYDKRDRLIEVKEDNVTIEAYTYDANGNRASATINGVTTTASYTLDDQLIVYGQNSYLYDEDGYLEEKTTPEGTTTYSYGTLGELKQVTTPTQTITYHHNANNQRVAKLVDGVMIEKYFWADLTTLLAVYDANDNLVQRFEYADQRMPLSMTDGNGSKYYLHYDQVGTLRAVSDINHHIIKEVTYDTYGNILEDSNEDFKVPFGFAGGLYDSDTKLTRFGYRDYDAYTGKWTAKDPIGFAGGDSNLYGYVLGDPVNFVDPNGLFLSLALNHKKYIGKGSAAAVITYGIGNFLVKSAENYRRGEMISIMKEECYYALQNDCQYSSIKCEGIKDLEARYNKSLYDIAIEAFSLPGTISSGSPLPTNGIDATGSVIGNTITNMGKK